VKLRTNTLTSIFLGIGIRPQDQDELDAQERAFFYEQVEPEINRFRDLGAPLPDANMIDDSVYRYLGLDVPKSNTSAAKPWGLQPVEGKG
jgi:hypothetical protein